MNTNTGPGLATTSLTNQKNSSGLGHGNTIDFNDKGMMVGGTGGGGRRRR